ncbi:MAG: hypothetical protein M1475_05150 [Actinobacteria bacterium]|nr:hypothetical protein [Actinomycetota bacterium]
MDDFAGMKAMISLSLGERDQPISDYFCTLIKLAGFEIEIVKPGDPEESASERVKNCIKNNDVFISILSAKHELKNGRYMPSSWLIDEIGRAVQAEKPIGVFIEEGITDIDHLVEVIKGDYLQFKRTENPIIMPDKIINYLKKLIDMSIN